MSRGRGEDGIAASGAADIDGSGGIGGGREQDQERWTVQSLKVGQCRLGPRITRQVFERMVVGAVRSEPVTGRFPENRETTGKILNAAALMAESRSRSASRWVLSCHFPWIAEQGIIRPRAGIASAANGIGSPHGRHDCLSAAQHGLKTTVPAGEVRRSRTRLGLLQRPTPSCSLNLDALLVRLLAIREPYPFMVGPQGARSTRAVLCLDRLRASPCPRSGKRPSMLAHCPRASALLTGDSRASASRRESPLYPHVGFAHLGVVRQRRSLALLHDGPAIQHVSAGRHLQRLVHVLLDQ